MIEHVENHPGMLEKVTRPPRRCGDQPSTAYLATDTRLVLGCENLSALEAAWKELSAVAYG